MRKRVMPTITKPMPNTSQSVNGSPRKITATNAATIGCRFRNDAVREAPIRFSAKFQIAPPIPIETTPEYSTAKPTSHVNSDQSKCSVSGIAMQASRTVPHSSSQNNVGITGLSVISVRSEKVMPTQMKVPITVSASPSKVVGVPKPI